MNKYLLLDYLHDLISKLDSYSISHSRENEEDFFYIYKGDIQFNFTSRGDIVFIELCDVSNHAKISNSKILNSKLFSYSLNESIPILDLLIKKLGEKSNSNFNLASASNYNEIKNKAIDALKNYQITEQTILEIQSYSSNSTIDFEDYQINISRIRDCLTDFQLKLTSAITLPVYNTKNKQYGNITFAGYQIYDFPIFQKLCNQSFSVSESIDSFINSLDSNSHEFVIELKKFNLEQKLPKNDNSIKTNKI